MHRKPIYFANKAPKKVLGAVLNSHIHPHPPYKENKKYQPFYLMKMKDKETLQTEKVLYIFCSFVLHFQLSVLYIYNTTLQDKK